MIFADRSEAGRQLAEELRELSLEKPAVLGLARGGVPVAAAVARELGAPLDVLVVRKLGCPGQPELGIGAVGELGVRVLNTKLIARLGVADEQIEDIARREGAEVDRRVERYRRGSAPVKLKGRTAILVDDGLATGFTAGAAVGVVRQLQAVQVVLAVPVAPRQAVESLEEVADRVVALQTPPDFMAVGQWYRDFTQVSDEEVSALLASAPSEQAGSSNEGRT
ncbi:MAG: phosphoribosyltransferase [Actinobacteria bacterium]|nr:phosphoribosyltransferase [Actinomycetota bacterium]